MNSEADDPMILVPTYGMPEIENIIDPETFSYKIRVTLKPDGKKYLIRRSDLLAALAKT